LIKNASSYCICLTTLVLLLLLASPATAVPNPHEVLSEGDNCVSCHLNGNPDINDKDSLVLKGDLVEQCAECHPDQLVTGHPVNKKHFGSRRVPLPLDDNEEVVCITCHSPHLPWKDKEPYIPVSIFKKIRNTILGKGEYRTYFLRINNRDGQLCLTCHVSPNMSDPRQFYLTAHQPISLIRKWEAYSGSEKCAECHRTAYDLWKKTPHANMIRDARGNPAAIKAQSFDDVTFKRDQVLYVLGDHWTQRYLGLVDNQLYAFPKLWSITENNWMDYIDYSWKRRPWTTSCAGCHTTGYVPEFGIYNELSISCESCHGPGRTHAETGDPGFIVNPDKLSKERRDMVCEACHTTGTDVSGEYEFPVGYRPGEDLMKYYFGLYPKPGQTMDEFFGDGTYEDRHNQFIYWAGSLMVSKGLACDTCISFRLPKMDVKEKKQRSHSEYCGSCHLDKLESFKEHSDHKPESVQCPDCHYPTVAPGGAGFSIHDHKYLFGTPPVPHNQTIEEACQACHQ
jgi:cytochrome c554/c'-like protein